MASSPLASLSANAIARKRQRSADETDEINLFRPKRQPFVTCKQLAAFHYRPCLFFARYR